MIESRKNLETFVLSLTVVERSRARKFLLSPYHNQRQDVIRLYEILLDVSNHNRPTEQIFTLLFGDSINFDSKKVRYVRSELLDLLRQFAAIDKLKRDQASFAILQATAMLDRKQYRQVGKLFKNSEKAINSTVGHKAQINTYLLSKEKLRFGFDRQDFSQELLQLHSADLTEFFILQKLRLFCLAETYRTRFPAQFDFPLRKKILDFLANQSLSENALVVLYLSAFKMLSSEESLQHFNDLKSGITAIEKNIEADSLKELYLIAINYVIGRINRGEEMFEEIFQLYKHGITDDIFLEDGELSPGTYRNIVLAGLRLKEFTWIDQFLDDFRDKLPPRNRLHHYRYNRAVFAFRKKSYRETFDLLQRVRTQDVHMNLDMRRMQTIMYFEENEFEVLEHHLESLLRYLRRHKKEMTYHHAIWADFVRATRMLIRIQYGQKDLSHQLVAFLDEHRALPSRGWLLQQVQ